MRAAMVYAKVHPWDVKSVYTRKAVDTAYKFTRPIKNQMLATRQTIGGEFRIPDGDDSDTDI